MWYNQKITDSNMSYGSLNSIRKFYKYGDNLNFFSMKKLIAIAITYINVNLYFNFGFSIGIILRMLRWTVFSSLVGAYKLESSKKLEKIVEFENDLSFSYKFFPLWISVHQVVLFVGNFLILWLFFFDENSIS